MFAKSDALTRKKLCFEFCSLNSSTVPVPSSAGLPHSATAVDSSRNDAQLSASSDPAPVNAVEVVSKGELTKVLTMLHEMYNGQSSNSAAANEASLFCTMMFEKVYHVTCECCMGVAVSLLLACTCRLSSLFESKHIPPLYCCWPIRYKVRQFALPMLQAMCTHVW